MSEPITQSIQELAPGALLELFIIDLTPIATAAGVFNFHAGTNYLRQPLTWQGVLFTPMPIQVTGFEYSGQGPSPRPKLTVSALFGAIRQLNIAYDDLIGGTVTRIRTFAKYIDAINYPGGVNPNADPTAELPRDVYFIEQKIGDTGIAYEYTLIAPTDLQGMTIPTRTAMKNYCPSQYRGSECGYTGGPVADIYDNPTHVAAVDQCSKTVTGCKMRWCVSPVTPMGYFTAAVATFGTNTLNLGVTIASTSANLIPGPPTLNSVMTSVPSERCLGVILLGGGITDLFTFDYYDPSQGKLLGCLFAADYPSGTAFTLAGSGTVLPFGGFPGVGGGQ